MDFAIIYYFLIPAEKPVFSWHETSFGLIHAYLGKLRIRNLFEGYGVDA